MASEVMLNDEQKATLANLAAGWLQAKSDEVAANSARVETEAEILKLIGSRVEGSATSTFGDVKIETTGVMNRKCKDWPGLRAALTAFPSEFAPIKPSLDETGVKWLEKNRPEIYTAIAPFLETKPGKTGVKVSIIDLAKAA